MKKMKSKGYGAAGDAWSYGDDDTRTGFSASAVGATINGTAGNDTLLGTADDDTINGLAGDDVLNGKAGSDTMRGGLGHDTYYVDRATDVIVESSNQGNDVVFSTVTYTLAANVEQLALTGDLAINGTGNSLNNTIVGNSAANTLSGGAGIDWLDGGKGIDTLIGGTGHDTYFVDRSTDIVVEAANEGLDSVYASSSYRLPANVEYLSLIGDRAINGIGNEMDNYLVGNEANNILNAKAGADFYIGYGGNDTYYVDNALDIVLEFLNEGTDNVISTVSHALFSNVENLTLIGTRAANAVGNELNNVITGNAAANKLLGGDGSDTLDGGLGADTFIFDSTVGVDKVVHFSLTEGDKIDISDLLSGYDPAQHALSDFVRITESGGNSVLRIDVDGRGAGAALTQIAVFEQVTGLPDVNHLIASGNLIIHH